MKHGIITGGSRGIGLATVELLSQDQNTNIISTSTSGKHNSRQSRIKCVQLDLSSTESISSFVKSIQSTEIDFLINNAAVLIEDWNKADIDIEQLRNTFEVNLFGTIELTEKLLPLIDSKAHIINITSDWGSFSEKNFNKYQPHYKMSKAALNMYTRLLAKRLAKNKIIVSSLDPGWTKTDMGGIDGSRNPLEVAKDIKLLLNSNVKSGLFWHQGKVRDW
ncbi:MAG: SDR family NAD(P)-dependent oxidoreductase [Bacteroidetes bacterium]|nr:SDR family NAD(P)-dependent oxidoreductase [Bacteroidota bacterium]